MRNVLLETHLKIATNPVHVYDAYTGAGKARKKPSLVQGADDKFRTNSLAAFKTIKEIVRVNKF
jgi:hypothetical protein